jgi:subtilisin family serine protease
MIKPTVHGNAVSGRVPVDALSDMSTISTLRFMRPSMARTQVGLTTSQGDHSQRSDVARQRFHVNGTGVRVGVMSDSYNCSEGALVPGEPFTTAPQDKASNDLPQNVLVLKDLSPTPSSDCSDEGRGMMQLIHDVAPASPLAFYTAFESAEDFAAGIVALADAGSKVIVDDVIYFAEPMYLDGPIAQAADRVKSRGVAYFSSAGNQARQSYESTFRRSGSEGAGGGVLHDFRAGKGADVLQGITAQAESASLLSFQWDQPWFSVNGKGSASDLDIYFVDDDGTPITLCDDDPDALVCQFPGIDQNEGADAVETPVLINDSEEDVHANIAIELFSGPAPRRMKYVWFDLGNGLMIVEEHDTQSGTLYGHANAAGAEAVGAAPWYNTAAYGPQNKPECAPACLELFSSAGGVPILFDKSGRRFPFPLIRIKPGLTGPDGGNTTFFIADIAAPIPGSTEPDGFPNFFGTSASAPHVAAIAALMLDQRARDIAAGKRFIGSQQLRPDVMYIALRLSAARQDIRQRAGRVTGPFPIPHSKGFDFDSGFGFVDAATALRLTAGF